MQTYFICLSLFKACTHVLLSLIKLISLIQVIKPAVLPFGGGWHTLGSHLSIRIQGLRSVCGLCLSHRTILSSFLNMIETNCKDGEWWNTCADIYTWHFSDKWMLITATVMFSSSFSGTISIIVSTNWNSCHFQQQITKEILPAPELLQSKYHKGRRCVPP